MSGLVHRVVFMYMLRLMYNNNRISIITWVYRVHVCVFGSQMEIIIMNKYLDVCLLRAYEWWNGRIRCFVCVGGGWFPLHVSLHNIDDWIVFRLCTIVCMCLDSCAFFARGMAFIESNTSPRFNLLDTLLFDSHSPSPKSVFVSEQIAQKFSVLFLHGLCTHTETETETFAMYVYFYIDKRTTFI